MNDKIAIIDTNIFYYISGLASYEKSYRIIPFIKDNYKDFLVSDLSVLELIVKNRNNRDIIVDGVNYLVKNNIKGHKLIPETDSFIKYLDQSIMESNINFDKLIDTAFDLKLNIEREFLLFWFGYTISTFIAVIYDKADFDIYKFDLLEKQLMALFLSMKDEKGYIYGELSNYLLDLYDTGKESVFKQKINYLLLNALFVATSMLESSSQGQLIFLDSPSKFDQYLKNTENKNNKEIKLLEKKMIPKLEGTLDQIIDKLKPLIGHPLAKFYAILTKKFLSLENKLFNKNDIIDGLLLKSINDYQLLTLDKGFISIIKDIDQLQYNNIIIFKNALV
jgi:hypothetical protein